MEVICISCARTEAWCDFIEPIKGSMDLTSDGGGKVVLPHRDKHALHVGMGRWLIAIEALVACRRNEVRRCDRLEQTV